jgi:hypothetical protein
LFLVLVLVWVVAPFLSRSHGTELFRGRISGRTKFKCRPQPIKERQSREENDPIRRNDRSRQHVTTSLEVQWIIGTTIFSYIILLSHAGSIILLHHFALYSIKLGDE